MRPSGQNKALVRKYLERRGRAMPCKIAKFLRLTIATAMKYLRELCSEGLAHQSAARCGSGLTAIFYAGQKPVSMASLPGRVFRDGVAA